MESPAMKKLFHTALLCTVFMLSFGLAPAGAQESVSLSEAEFVGNLWFVELSGAPTADGNSLANVRAEKAAFKKAAAAAGISYVERRSFDVLFNGYSVEIDAANRLRLAAVTGVKALWPVELIQMPPIETLAGGAAPDLATAIAMTGANIAQSSLGLTGAGVKVAIMDTGTDYHHPDLGGCFGPGCRVAMGYDFVGDAFNADPSSTAYNPTPAPDPDPDDCNGHGTHVSGIVGANGVVDGVAPGVTFGAYRVFGCAGSTTGDIMIAAMERALADGMQVLNMSIGSAFQWPQYPTAQASDRLVNKGVSVVASIGNSGANGLYSAGAPGLGKKVIGVASYDNTHVTLATFTVTPANLTIGYGNAAAAPPAPTSGSLPLARTGTPTTGNDGCAIAGALPNLTGMAVLIRRGTCGFYEKSRRAQLAGASAVVLYNNAAGRFSPTVAVGPGADGNPVTIPVVAVSDTEGVSINNAIAAAAQTLNWQSGTASFVNPTGNLISSFSSYGLSPDLALKPDIGAPGGLIYSTYPLEQGGYATISGTSMSSPHTAGGVALLLEARPNTSSQAVRGILQNSADPKNWFGNPGLGFLDNVHRQGAGMLDIDDAILATTTIEPGKIAAGEGQAGPFAQTLTLKNSGSSAVTYDLSFVNALSTGGVITPSFTTSNASVGFSAPSVTVPAGGSATVNATITPATGPTNGQYGGYIVFTPQGGGQVYRVPFAGFVGDYQGIQVMTGGFPVLGRLNSCAPAALLRGLDCFGTGGYSGLPAGATFNLTAAIGQTPYFLVHLEHQVRKLRAEVFSTGGKAWHRIFDEDYVGRNSVSTTPGPGTFFAFPWDGTTVAGNKAYTVPDGQYVVKISVLKALGDAANPAHWETWTSPVITIDRP
jgi:minor extracellular serine protease Vpr